MVKKWSALLGIAVVAALGLGFWGYQQNQEKQLMQTALGNNYQRAFYNAAYHVQNAEVLLGKSLVSAGPQSSQEFFEQIWNEAEQARANITQLPMGDALLGRTVKFIAQVGDYSQMLSEQVSGGKPVSSEQWDTLNRLYNQASDLNEELGKIHAGAADGSFNFYELALTGSRRLAREGGKLASASFQGIDRQMYGYPTLIYDGPFSDHMEQSRARGVTGQEITREKARSEALRYFDNKDGGNVIAQVTGSVEGSIPAYRVEIVRRNNGRVDGLPTVADVSRKGGHLIWLLNQRNVPNENLNIEKAAAVSEKYLQDHGYGNMKQSYYQRNDNTVTFNYALVQDNVVIYPDLVKVTVALDNGQVVGFDAKGYLMSHHKRNIPKPGITESEARDLVSDNLKIEGKGRLALIPLDVDKERLTWEFKGSLDTDSYLVYINALDGREEQVLKLIQNDNGTLTM